MIGQLFGFILVYILLTLTSSYATYALKPPLSFADLVPCFFILLGSLYMSGYLERVNKICRSFAVAQIGLLTFLFLLSLNFMQRPMPLAPFFLHTLCGFALYLIGLTSYYCGLYSDDRNRIPLQQAWRSLRLALPFALAFILLSCISDLFVIVEQKGLGSTFEALTTLGLLLGVSVVFPPFIVTLWGCRELESTELKAKLEQLCQRLKFSYRKILSWNALENIPTAAILGIYPRFRYIVFTPKLQRILPEASLEAVLAHEIGHSHDRHLWFYPLITAGVAIFGYALASLFSWEQFSASGPSVSLILAGVLAVFAWTALYFRLVFGYFSRLFERQADGYVIKIGLGPQGLAEGLRMVAYSNGQDPAKPCWHHYSIQQRIDYLYAAAADKDLLSRHDFWVRVSLGVFIGMLGAAFWYSVFELYP